MERTHRARARGTLRELGARWTWFGLCLIAGAGACGDDDDTAPLDDAAVVAPDASDAARDAGPDRRDAEGAGDGAMRDAMATSPPIVERVRIDEVSITQGVEIALERAGVPVTTPNAPIVTERRGLVRLLLTPLEGAIALHGTMTVTHGGMDDVVEVDLDLSRPSDRGELGTSLDLPLAPELVTEDATVAIAIRSDVASGELLWPAEGETHALRAESVLRPVRVAIVPILNPAGTPTFSAEDLARLHDRVLEMFPISEIVIDVLETPLTFDGDLCGFDAWGLLLDAVIARRRADAPADGVYYAGMVAIDDFRCAEVGGIGGRDLVAVEDIDRRAFVATARNPASMRPAETIFAHELGHALGLLHAPCGTAGDPAYPYPGALVGVWGWSALRERLFDPALYTDFMSYCAPTWISDFHYARLFDWIRAVHALEGP